MKCNEAPHAGDTTATRERGSRWLRVPAIAFALAVSSVLMFSLLVPMTQAGGQVRPATFRASDCNNINWNTEHLAVGSNGCQEVFSVIYAENFSNWNASRSYNFSFSIDYVAEVDSANHLVRLANAIGPVSAQSSITPGRGQVDLSVVESLNATSAVGNWTPRDAWNLSGNLSWTQGSASLGTPTLSVVFHLQNSSAPGNGSTTSYQVKFDVGVSGWPWASRNDHLGFMMSSLAAWGSHFTYDAASGALAETWNSTNVSYASVGFGPQARATLVGGLGTNATTSIATGLFWAASPDREAVSLVTFNGTAGGYTAINYDPVVAFVPGLSPVPPVNHAASVSWWPYIVGGVVALTVAVIASILLVRGRRLRREGTAIVGEIHRILGDEPEPPRRG
ncbi:MAG TPA: hypothetical protein VEY07_03695 [Thermoplasmata archaeon]|nr:hypothetical protein [Thermoplasmata archaeon]